MSLFGPTQEQHDQLAAQLKAALSNYAQKEVELKKANAGWKSCYDAIETTKKEAAAEVDQATKRAEAAEKERDRLQQSITSLGKAAEGWHNFGGDTWQWLDSINYFKTKEYRVDPNDYSSPEIRGVEEINGHATKYPHPTVDEVLAVLNARRKAKRGGGAGGAGGDDLPSAPMAPTPKPFQGPQR